MPLAGDVASYLKAVSQAYASYLAQSRVRFFGGSCIDARTDAALLRTGF